MVDVVQEAFERLQIFGPALEAIHLEAARRSLNLMFMEWSANGPNPWAVDQQTQTLAVGTASYTAPVGTISMLQTWSRQVVGSQNQDTMLTPLSRSGYAAITDKAQAGPPNQFYLDRQKTPIIYPWPVANVTGYTLMYYRIKYIQDITAALSEQGDVPGYWLEAMCAGLAAKLAVKFQPAAARDMNLLASAAYGVASRDDSERQPISIYPDLSQYNVI